MYHSIWIDDKNTFDDFSIVPVTRPVVNEPDTIKIYVDAHGIDGPIDLTEAITGRQMYKSRTGSWDFHVKNYTASWDAICHRLANYVHGRRAKVRLEDDRYYYYMGRLEVDKFSSAPAIRINYTLEPYKYEINSANEPWLWDPFDFETGVIRNYGCDPSDEVEGLISRLTVNGNDSLTVVIEPTMRPHPIMIHLLTGTDVTVKIGGGTREYPLSIGENDMTAVTGYAAEDKRMALVFSGHGTLWVEFRGGWL